jgi:F0F1-type ATP synthase assembly protein I
MDMPTGPRNPRKPDGVLSTIVRAEAMLQIALLFPASTFIGWLIGVGLDHWLHQHWIYIAGLLFGAAAGFVQLFFIVKRNLS